MLSTWKAVAYLRLDHIPKATPDLRIGKMWVGTQVIFILFIIDPANADQHLCRRETQGVGCQYRAHCLLLGWIRVGVGQQISEFKAYITIRGIPGCTSYMFLGLCKFQ